LLKWAATCLELWWDDKQNKTDLELGNTENQDEPFGYENVAQRKWRS